MTEFSPYGLPVQPARLPGDVQYVLDNAVEQTEIDLGTYVALKLFGKRTEVSAIIDRERPNPELGVYRHGRLEMMRDLVTYATGLIRDLNPELQGALLYASLTRFHHDLRRFEDYYASTTITDALEGGFATPYKRFRRGQTKVARDTTVWPMTAKIRRRLYSPHFIRRTAKRFEESAQLRALFNRFSARIKNLDVKHIVDGYDLFDRALEEQRRLREILDAETITRIEASRRGEADWDDDPASRARHLKMPGRAARKLERRHRALIKRTLRMAETILEPDQVRAFVKGEPVEIVGPTVRFVIRNSCGVAWLGHGGLNVHIEDRLCRKLADLCLYIKDVPALEQVALLKMYMGDGEGELDILTAANATGLTEAGCNHPTLLARKKRVRDEINSGRAQRRENPISWQTRNQNYIADTRELWRDAIEVYVYGRRVSGRPADQDDDVESTIRVAHVVRELSRQPLQGADNEGQLERRAA